MAKKKPSILEGEVARVLGRADKLKIPNVKGGMSLWVPEDTVTTKTKSVNKNGTYLPKDDDCYGYSKVTVNVPGSRMVGEGPDGNDYLVEEEFDENGNPTGDHIVTKRPSGIKIVRPPDNRNYKPGDPINFSGMIVMMTTKNGGLFMDAEHPTGALSHGELEFPITVAQGGGDGRGSDFDLSPMPNPISVLMGLRNEYEYDTSNGKNRYVYEFVPSVNDVVFFTWHLSDDDIIIRSFFASKTNGVIGVLNEDLYVYNKGGELVNERHRQETITASTSYTYDGKTVYRWYGNNSIFGVTRYSSIQPMYILPGNYPHSDELAWTMVYGTKTGGDDDIPVEWDTGKYNLKNAPFTDSFKINVTGSTDSGGFSDYEGGTF